jgi:hypothetical protein
LGRVFPSTSRLQPVGGFVSIQLTSHHSPKTHLFEHLNQIPNGKRQFVIFALFVAVDDLTPPILRRCFVSAKRLKPQLATLSDVSRGARTKKRSEPRAAMPLAGKKFFRKFPTIKKALSHHNSHARYSRRRNNGRISHLNRNRPQKSHLKITLSSLC